MHEEAVCQNEPERIVHKKENPLMNHHIALKSELGNIMSDIPNSRSEFISTLYVYKLAYQLLLKTMMGELSVGRLSQALHIYSYIQTQSKLLCVLYNTFILIMSDLCTVVLLSFG